MSESRKKNTSGWDLRDIRPTIVRLFLAGTSVTLLAECFDLKVLMVEDIIRGFAATGTKPYPAERA